RHGPSTALAAFHVLDGLHFESMTVSNNFHNTWNFSFQSTNLFQDVTGPTNGEFQIVVNHPGFPTANFQNDESTQDSLNAVTVKLKDLHSGKAVLVLQAGFTLSGMVTDEYGYHVAGAKVSVGRFFPKNDGVVTESDGSFVRKALPAGENFITITADGFAPQRIPVQMTSNTPPLAVQLKPGAVLRLRIVDQNASPIVSARAAAQGWQGPNTLDWAALADSGGRIVWNSAPLEPFSVSVLKDGYFSSRNNIVPADGQEHTIILHPQLTVVGLVTDAVTKQPIPSFKAIPGSERLGAAYGANGQFELTFTEYSQPLTVRIEADGYDPATSRPLDDRANPLTCNFTLRKQKLEEAIQGIVLLPDGNAGAGVSVTLCPTEHGVDLHEGKFTKMNAAITTETDLNGHFFFAAGSSARAVVAVHQEGIGSVPITASNRSVSIRLQPWGRIEGTLRFKSRPNADQQIALWEPPLGGRPTTLNLAYTTKTDEQGKFTFDQAPPGHFDLYLVKGSGPQIPVEVRAGETAVVQMGGSGGNISGRLVAPHSVSLGNWNKQLLFADLQTKLPGKIRQYYQSEEGRNLLRAVSTYSLDVHPDGTFKVEEVPPGDYVLRGQLSDIAVDLSMRVMGHIIGTFQKDVHVPQAGGDQSIEKIDLGTIMVQTWNQ
ncbi:MAG TPA: carboxypeptidase regulatory-like domain-containing protein, partial [Candidatus Saccharimonadales bacterium]|nr:carboxypeptidase regulatory-like domain-containing protein [Candidatus Saccharimonadales bacterium]